LGEESNRGRPDHSRAARDPAALLATARSTGDAGSSASGDHRCPLARPSRHEPRARAPRCGVCVPARLGDGDVGVPTRWRSTAQDRTNPNEPWDAYLRKYDPDGGILWTRQFGTSRDDFVSRVAVHSTGIYVVGRTHGAFPGNENTYIDGFIRKYDASGGVVWTHHINSPKRPDESPYTEDSATDVAVDATGVYVAGSSDGVLPGQTANGGFIRKYDHGGTEVWTRQVGTLAGVAPTGFYGIDVHKTGVYATTQICCTGTVGDAGSNTDLGIIRFGLDGGPGWFREFGTPTGNDYAYGIDVDATGVYLSGQTNGAFEGYTNAVNDNDAFVRSYTLAGAHRWTRQFGTDAHDDANHLAVDATGVYLAGATWGSLAGPNAGKGDIYVRKYYHNGNEGLTRQFGTAGIEVARSIAADATGLYITGRAEGDLLGSTYKGGQETFTAKLNVVPVPPDQTVEALSPPSTPLPPSQEGVQRIAYQGDPVNTLFGNFTHSHTDLEMPGLGPVRIVRSYNSALPRDGLLGFGWNITYDLRVTRPATGITKVERGDGRVDVYTGTNGAALVPPAGSVDRLVRTTAGTYTLTTRERITYGFNAGGRLVTSRDIDGNTTTLTYDASGRWTGITDAAGRKWTLAYSGPRISKITDPAGRSVSYTYDSAGNLVTTTNAARGINRYEYDAKHQLTRMLDTRGNLFVAHVYNSDGRVIQQTDGRGVHRFDYLPNRSIYTDPLGKTTTTYYDTKHRTTRTVDAVGNSHWFTYGPQGLVSSEKDALGRVTAYTYDSRGNTLTVRNALGGVTTMTYDARDNLLTAKDALGRTTTHTYDLKNRRLTTKDALGRTTTFTYTPKGQLATATDPTGATTTFGYDASGNRTTVTDALGKQTAYMYDTAGRVTKVTDELGRSTTTTYTALNLPLVVTAPDGGTTTYAYDAAGNTTSVRTVIRRATSSASAVIRTTTYTYDAANDLVSETNALGQTTTYTYDKLGRQLTRKLPTNAIWASAYDAIGRKVRETSPLGHATTFGYDKVGNLTTTTDANLNITRRTYDALNRLLTETDATNGVVTYTYDAVGNRTTVKDPRGNVTTYGYDAANQVTSEKNALLQTTSYSYDAAGRKVRVTAADGAVWTTTYDAVGRKTRESSPLGSTTSMTYDAAGNLLTTTDANLKVTRYAYDVGGRLVTVTDAAAGTTRFTYDLAGNRLSVTDARGSRTTYAYDLLGRPTTETNPLGHTSNTTYDAAGRVASTTDGVGQVTTYAYDAAGRTTTITAGPLVTRYTYDKVGNRLTSRHGATTAASLPTTTYAYDGAYRLKSVNGPQGLVTYTYDAAGNRTTMGQPGPQTVAYTYDVLNRLSTVKRNGTAVVSYAYDSTGNVTRQTYGNGFITTLGYDMDDRLTSMTTKNGTTIVGSYAYTLDKLGNRTKETSTGFTGTYVYDALSRLTGATVAVTTAGGASSPINTSYTYTYDAIGNRLTEKVGTTTTTYTYDAANRLRTVGARTYAYDNAGRLKSDGASTFTYDGFGRLAAIGGAGASTFGYDGDGNRVTEKVGATSTSYLLDQAIANPVRIASTAGSATQRFVYGLSRVGQVSSAGAISYEHSDGLGSVRMLTTATRAVAGRQNYAPFGARLNGSGAFGFTGEAYSAGGKLVHLRAREYDPAIGRFLTTDPHAGDAMRPQTWNEYQYVGNNPVNDTDPSGKWSYDDWEYKELQDKYYGVRPGCACADKERYEAMLQRYDILIEMEWNGWTSEYDEAMAWVYDRPAPAATVAVSSDAIAAGGVGALPEIAIDITPGILVAAGVISQNGGAILGQNAAGNLIEDSDPDERVQTLIAAELLANDGASAVDEEGPEEIQAFLSTLINQDGSGIVSGGAGNFTRAYGATSTNDTTVADEIAPTVSSSGFGIPTGFGYYGGGGIGNSAGGGMAPESNANKSGGAGGAGQ
jgi:RHS repeat-associated protein